MIGESIGFFLRNLPAFLLAAAPLLATSRKLMSLNVIASAAKQSIGQPPR
jgi:hypothetical protein